MTGAPGGPGQVRAKRNPVSPKKHRLVLQGISKSIQSTRNRVGFPSENLAAAS